MLGALGLMGAAAALAAGTDAQRQKAAVCESCHGIEGRSTVPDTPSLAGQPKQFITTQLVMYREGNRKNAIMNPIAAPLSNAEINELGSYFAAQAAEPAGKPLAAGAASAGKALSATGSSARSATAPSCKASSTSRASPGSRPSTCARNCSASRPAPASTWTAT